MPSSRLSGLKETKATSDKKTTKATATKKTTSKTATTKKLTKKSVSKKTTPKIEEKKFIDVPEYYDLPYRYNQTTVKVLYQNPTTLFVYWDISDKDTEHFKKEFGDNFFYITKPVLIVHNLTDNYSFEIDINDFTNNWYITVNDAKCTYSVELVRKPNQSDKIKDIEKNVDTDYIRVTCSNNIEIPNDHILFFKDNQKILFKNINTNSITEKTYKNNIYGKDVKEIYKNYNFSEEANRFDFNNPSSQNPTSNVM